MGATHVTIPRRRMRAVPLRALSDDRLARLAAQGDRDAFAAIFERHHQGIFRYCRSILLNADDAADALQNTMAAALRAINGEQRDLAVKSWLYRIAHNESISLVRRRRPHAELDDAATETPADDSSRERLQALVADLRELPERQRGALVMRELSGLDYDEIAAAFGMSAATAKQTVYEARRGLHEIAEGRDMSCDAIRELVSANDRRLLGGRRVRSHLRDCQPCRAFKDDIAARSRQLAMLAPPIAPLAAGNILNGLFGGGDGGGTGALMALFGKGASVKAGMAGIGAKGAVAATVAVSAGAAGVTAGVESAPFRGERAQQVAAENGRAAAAVAGPETAGRGGQADPAGDKSRARERRSAREARRDGRREAAGGARGNGGSSKARDSAGRPDGSRGRSGARPQPGSRRGAARSRPAPRTGRPTTPSPQTPPTGQRPPQSPPASSAPSTPAVPSPQPSAPVPQPSAPAPQPTAPAPPPPAPTAPVSPGAGSTGR